MHVSLEPGGLVVDTPNAICARRTWKIITRMAGERDDTETRKSDITSQKHSKLLKRYRILPRLLGTVITCTRTTQTRNRLASYGRSYLYVNVFSYSFFGHDLRQGLAVPNRPKIISYLQTPIICFRSHR